MSDGQGHAGQHRPTPPAPSGEQVVHQEVAGQDAQHEQGVHPGLGRVPDPEGQHREDGQGDQPRPSGPQAGGAGPAGQAGAGQVDQRVAGQRDQAGQRPDPPVAGAAEGGPDVQQHVVERRVAVPPERLADVAQGELGDVDAECLVQPQVGPGPEAGHGAGHHGHGAQPREEAVHGRRRHRLLPGPGDVRGGWTVAGHRSSGAGGTGGTAATGPGCVPCSSREIAPASSDNCVRSSMARYS